jgi:hypothetical protein
VWFSTLTESLPALPFMIPRIQTSRAPRIASTDETERFMAYAHSLDLKKLAQLSRASDGALSALYASCLDQRLQLVWGRYANWLMDAKGMDERTAIRMANFEFGETPSARLERALKGQFDDALCQAGDEQLAKIHGEALVAETDVEDGHSAAGLSKFYRKSRSP